MTQKKIAPKAIVFGLAGQTLTEPERDFFRRENPFGFILFARNCGTPAQVKALTGELRAAVGRPDAPILIDQEGGRVSRFQGPDWPKFPAARTFGEMYETDPGQAMQSALENGMALGKTLAAVGITVNCAPCCDLFLPQTTKAIGDRAFSPDPAICVALALAIAEGLGEAGVMPVIKHMPGHGRATADSHLQLPVVTAGYDELSRTDFAVFRPLASLPLGMSAHVVYTAVDPALPATLSPAVVQTVIRRDIGFGGFLFSDDLVMKALSGDRPALGRQALAAGMDCLLHCNGDLTEMAALAAATPPLSDAAQQAWQRAQGWLAARQIAPPKSRTDAKPPAGP